MSQQIEEIKNNAKAIQDGLKKMGANRTVALSVHVTKDLVADLEETTKELIQQLEGL